MKGRKKETLPGHQGLSPHVAQAPKAGRLQFQFSWLRVLGLV